MADRPILFSAPMVRALLAGTKTQTRRVLDAWTDEPIAYIMAGSITALDENEREYRWPRTHAKGDRLYVREHWRATDTLDAIAPRDMVPPVGLVYVADNERTVGAGRFRQGMHMPRWASRLTLHVTDVRVQRLQDISEADARAEGCASEFRIVIDRPDGGPDYRMPDCYRAGYANLWGRINGAGSWDANPWVAAYTFTVERANIDHSPSTQEKNRG